MFFASRVTWGIPFSCGRVGASLPTFSLRVCREGIVPTSLVFESVGEIIDNLMRRRCECLCVPGSVGPAFTEGFDTKDLQAAKALLAELQ